LVVAVGATFSNCVELAHWLSAEHVRSVVVVAALDWYSEEVHTFRAVHSEFFAPSVWASYWVLGQVVLVVHWRSAVFMLLPLTVSVAAAAVWY
jgi:hypothetical protein